MRKIIVLCFTAALANALQAQSPARSSGQPATNSRTTEAAPATAQTRVAPANTSQNSTSRSANPAAMTPRGAAATAQTRPDNSAGSTLSRSTGALSPAPTDRSTASRNTAAAPATPKTVPAQIPAALPAQPQPERQARVQWMTLEEALEKAKTDKKKIFIDVFTDWCGWCKRMDESTFVNPAVAQYLNENYYPVKFNAEQQEKIVFNNKTYEFKRNGARGYHELAAELLNNRLSFPTVVFLDESLNVIQPIPGYLEAPKLETILNYFGTDSHKTTPWDTYEKKFNTTQQR